MEEIRDGQIEVGFVHKGLDDLLAKLDTLFNRLVVALIVVGGLIGSSIIGIFATTGPQVLGINVISIVGFALSPCSGSGSSGAWSGAGGCRAIVTLSRERTSGGARSRRLASQE